MKIVIETVPHNEQRYETVGDYWWDNETLHIRVSETGNTNYDYLIAIHELVEAVLCEYRGVSVEDIDKFDILHPELIEPGDHPQAPYQNEHNFATAVERMICAAMGIKWQEYDQTLDKLGDVES